MAKSKNFITELELLLDTVLPGDEILGLPSARQAGVSSFLKNQGKLPLIIEYVDKLNSIAHIKYEKSWQSLDVGIRLQCIEISLRADLKLANSAISQLLKGYYSSETVLVQLNAGSVPPFPSGNVLKDNNWDLLESVFERGPIYRTVNGLVLKN